MYQTTIDNSRDRRIEDPTNSLLFDPIARRVLPLALRWRVSANAVTFGGLAIGTLAAAAYLRWIHPAWAVLGLALSLAWLVADSLDGMVARVTGTTSDWGRELDGLCDHAVFVLLYIAFAWSVGTTEGYLLAFAASVAHVVQANLYEVLRARFHRRLRNEPLAPRRASPNPFARFYDRVAASFDRISPLDRVIAREGARPLLNARYVDAAIAPMRMMIPLSQNVRILAIYAACLVGSPKIFWWLEIAPLSALAVAGVVWLHHIETDIVLDPRIAR